MFTTTNLLLIATATTTALMAGLFFSWSCSVTPGIALLSDAGYLAAMQAMNSAIQNAVFFIAFMGTPLLLPLSTYLTYQGAASPRFWWLLAATLLYLAGVFGVTMFGNIPLNESLAGLNLHSASPPEMAAFRAGFEGPWNRLNMIRTVTSILSILFVTIACLSRGVGGMKMAYQ